MPTEQQRRERLQEILQLLKDKGSEAKFRVLYGEFVLKYGTTERTFWGYLDALRTAGKIDYDSLMRITDEHDRTIKLLK